MHTLRTRHSFPPLRKSRTSYFQENIDQDPFAYFISPASDRNIFNDDFTAGIDTHKRARSHSPTPHKSPIIRATATFATSPTAKLKKWIERMELRCFHRSPRASERPELSPEPPKPPAAPSILESSPPPRGRRDVRTSSNSRSKPRRPRAWREPSEDIWPVEEEKEDVGLGISV